MAMKKKNGMKLRNIKNKKKNWHGKRTCFQENRGKSKINIIFSQGFHETFWQIINLKKCLFKFLSVIVL